MNKDRLLRIADLMDRVHAEHLKFDITGWGGARGHYGEGDTRFEDYATTIARVEPECGTAACAMGYSALDPSFQAEGLKMTATFWSGDSSEPISKIDVSSVAALNDLIFVAAAKKAIAVDVTVEFEGKTGFDAAAEFLEIWHQAAHDLFYGPKNLTAADVANRIREFVKENDK